MEKVDKLTLAVNTPKLHEAGNKESIIKELQDLTLELERISNEYLAGSFTSWLKSEHPEQRSWNQEVRYAVTHRNEGYTPKLIYARLERGWLDNPEEKLDIEGGLNVLEELSENLPTRYARTKDFAQAAIDKRKRQFMFLKALKEGDLDKAAQLLPWKPPSPETIEEANKIYSDRLRKPPKEIYPDIVEKLKSEKFDAHEILHYFQYATRLVGARDFTWEIDNTINAITIYPEKNLGKIPSNRKVNGITLLKLINHEIGVHIGTLAKARENGFGAVALGEDAPMIQEGIAILSEKMMDKVLFGKSEPVGPYRILAIERAIQNDGDFWDTYDYLVNLRVEELRAQGISEDYINKNKDKLPLVAMRRMFYCGRTDLSQPGFVRTSDKDYFEGWLVAKKLREQGLLGYMLAGKYDLEVATIFIENSVLPQDASSLTIDVAQKIWLDREERQMMIKTGKIWQEYVAKFHNEPYWRGFGITDEEYLEAWKKLSPFSKKYNF